MDFPAFFDEVPRITLRDPLAELLGSVHGGLLSYGDKMPTRGDIQVSLRDPQTMRLMQLCLSGQATDQQRTAFGQLWQARVQRILLDHAWDGRGVRDQGCLSATANPSWASV